MTRSPPRCTGETKPFGVTEDRPFLPVVEGWEFHWLENDPQPSRVDYNALPPNVGRASATVKPYRASAATTSNVTNEVPRIQELRSSVTGPRSNPAKSTMATKARNPRRSRIVAASSPAATFQSTGHPHSRSVPPNPSAVPAAATRLAAIHVFRTTTRTRNRQKKS